jgi:hypothetical protein
MIYGISTASVIVVSVWENTGKAQGVLVTHDQTYLRCEINTPGTPSHARRLERIETSSHVIDEFGRVVVEQARGVIEVIA